MKTTFVDGWVDAVMDGARSLMHRAAEFLAIVSVSSVLACLSQQTGQSLRSLVGRWSIASVPGRSLRCLVSRFGAWAHFHDLHCSTQQQAGENEDEVNIIVEETWPSTNSSPVFGQIAYAKFFSMIA